MGDCFLLLSPCVRKERKGWKVFFVMRQVLNVKLMEEDPGMSVKQIYVERGRLVAVIGERIRIRNHDEDELLRRNMEAWDIKVHDAKSLCRWSVPAYL